MTDSEPPQQVSAVEIARLAGVGRAAVSNWRRRHADFPRPVGGSETSPAFSLAEVEGWLRAQGKIAEVPLRERVRRRIELLRDPAASPAAPLVPALAHLLLLRRDPARWRSLAATDDLALATSLPAALAEQALLLGPGGARLLRLPPLFGSTQLELARLLADVVAEQGVPATAAELVAGYADGANRQAAAVSSPVAELLADLSAADHAAVGFLDPACGNGALLLEAARRGASALHGQEADATLAAVALLRIALDAPADLPGPLPLGVAAGDALRADAWPTVLADAVLSRPPYNERNWGADELGYDPRWEYGLPARAESELAWVQHALARVRPGGLVTLLLPGAVAARRSGRRIRAELLRRGALRAVAALPVGVTAPYPAALHIWMLRRPLPGETPPARVLLVDASAAGDRYARTVLDAWRGFGADGSGLDGPAADAFERPGHRRAVPVIDLLDDETDLTPARHLPQRAADAHGELEALGRQLDALLAELAPLRRSLPGYGPADGDASHRAATTVAELIRAGALELLAEGEPPRPGDVVVPGPGAGPVGVHDDAVAELPSPVQLLRPDQTVLDPWFLAGLLAAARTDRAVSTTATGSGTSLRDLRRTRVPRLPLAEQRRYARPFRQLALFQQRLRLAGELGEQLAQGITTGLADGGLTPA
ncbi:MAG TPA: N-6 DNA methylase [Streptosporangiaceae bacterium]|nr:N-6 DNA methylase [Streptosporangiaceae bacterium]